MPKKLHRFLQALLDFWVMIRPAWHNRLAYILIIAGLSMYAGKWWYPFIQAAFKDKLDINVPDYGGNTEGFYIILLGCIYHIISSYLIIYGPNKKNVRTHIDNDRDLLDSIMKNIDIDSMQRSFHSGKKEEVLTELKKLHILKINIERRNNGFDNKNIAKKTSAVGELIKAFAENYKDKKIVNVALADKLTSSISSLYDFLNKEEVSDGKYRR